LSNKILTNYTSSKQRNTLENFQKKWVKIILVSKNEKLLVAIDKSFDYTQTEDIIALYAEELELLKLAKCRMNKNYFF